MYTHVFKVSTDRWYLINVAIQKNINKNEQINKSISKNILKKIKSVSSLSWLTWWVGQIKISLFVNLDMGGKRLRYSSA